VMQQFGASLTDNSRVIIYDFYSTGHRLLFREKIKLLIWLKTVIFVWVFSK